PASARSRVRRSGPLRSRGRASRSDRSTTASGHNGTVSNMDDNERGVAPIIVVMGVTGVGKTTIGRLLAVELGLPFLDADDFHTDEARAKMHAGIPLTDADRAPWLDRLNRALRDHASTGAVLACSALTHAYRQQLGAGVDHLG